VTTIDTQHSTQDPAGSDGPGTALTGAPTEVVKAVLDVGCDLFAGLASLVQISHAAPGLVLVDENDAYLAGTPTQTGLYGFVIVVGDSYGPQFSYMTERIRMKVVAPPEGNSAG
jgi:hypothetical protein